LAVWPRFFEQLYATLSAAAATRSKKRKRQQQQQQSDASSLYSPFRDVRQQLEVYEFVRAAGLSCPNRVGTDAADPDGAATVRDSIRVDSSLEEQAYTAILGQLVDEHPGLQMVHLSPQQVFGWSAGAGGDEEEMLRWCRANKARLQSNKYVVFHWGQDHYCSLIMNLEMWQAGFHGLVDAEAETEKAAALPSKRSRRTPGRIAVEDDSVYSSSVNSVPFIHLDTLPASCHFLLEHSAFLISVCRTFNTLFGTEWPVDPASLRSHVHLAGPSLQEDEWSCGYHLLYAWSLLFPSLRDAAAPVILTPSRVTAVCAAMADRSAAQLVEFTLDRYDAVVAAAPVCKGTSS
jgi:hypothetical protein